MKQTELGNSGLSVSAVGMGCMGLSHAYGEAMNLREIREVVLKAVDLGYTLFDTAEVYGTDHDPHHNERMLGEILGPVRDKIVLATKFGIRFDDSDDGNATHPLITDSSPEAIRASVEGSLSRLQTDRIDLYYQHRIDPKVEPEVVAEVMSELIKEGKVLHWGISEANEEYLRRAHAVCPVAAIQNRYSMMARWHESLFPVLEELGVGFVAFSPMANGLLTGCYNAQSEFDRKTDFRASMPQYSKESFEKNQALFDLINHLAAQYDATPAQISLAWMINKGIVPIPGTRKVTRLEENAGSAAIEMTTDELKRIDTALDSMEMSEVFGGSKIVK
ncbi:MAG: aldo/keto reductase [Bacteroidaceae bacterium]|nr:aldo/keto reductase [Bacteroidaceae bacterium]